MLQRWSGTPEGTALCVLISWVTSHLDRPVIAGPRRDPTPELSSTLSFWTCQIKQATGRWEQSILGSTPSWIRHETPRFLELPQNGSRTVNFVRREGENTNLAT